MANEQKKSNNYVIFIVILIIVLVLIGVYWYFIIRNGQKSDFVDTRSSIQKNQLDEELARVKNDNSAVLEKADNQLTEKIRGIDNTDHVIGEIGSPIHVITYIDFESPFCAEFFDTLNEVAREYGDKVVIAIRHFPLTSHSNALSAALASECASEQGQFFDMYDKLFFGNKDNALNSENYKKYAEEIGLDMQKFDSCLNEEKYKEKIQAHITEARNASVTGAPGSFVNGEVIPGAVPFEDYKGIDGLTKEGMKSIIERHLEQISKS